jgi:hypothetical protein
MVTRTLTYALTHTYTYTYSIGFRRVDDEVAERKTKAIAVASPKEQTPRASGPTLLSFPLKHKHDYFNKQCE